MKFSRLIIAILTLSLCSLSAWGQRYDRGYDTSKPVVFASKGTFTIGGTARFSWHDNDDYQFAVLDNINSTGYKISASPYFLYFLKDNIGLGFRATYDRNMLDLNSADLSVSEISMSVRDYYRITQTFGAAILLRPYIPLGPSGRYTVFAEVGLGGNMGRVKNTAQVGDQTKGTYTEKYKIYLSVNPGVSILFSNHFGLELSVGMLGVSYKWNNQVHNQVSSGSTDGANASFMVNLASISVGIAYYL